MDDSFLRRDAVTADPKNHQADSNGPAELLHSVLIALDASAWPYALIHDDRNLEEAIRSDVDIAFDRNPNEILLPILERLSQEHNARLIQCLHYDIPHGYYYVLSTAGIPHRFLHLDCLYDPLGVNRYHLPTPFLLADAVAGHWAKRTGKDKRAIYLLLKRAIKGNVSQEQLAVLRSCFGDATDALWSDVRNWFGPRARDLVEQLLQPQSPERVGALLANLHEQADGRFRRQHPLRYLLSLIMNVLRKLRRFVQPTGLFVVILGPDGSGKSTVSGLVLSQLERAFRRTWRFHWRPNLLPKLSRRATESRELEIAPQLPAEVSKYRGIISLARFLYYWLDFVLGYWLIIYPRKAQTTLVVGERYFPDVLVHPQRYGFTVPRWIMRLAGKWVPSPDLLIVLKDDPHVIYARKPELPPAKIASQIQAYEDEVKHWGGGSVIITKGGAAAAAVRIADLILTECARRTQIRLGQCDRAPQYRGFPSAKNAKVWFSDDDTLSNSLNLYHPYSKSGRFAMSLLGCLPLAVHHCLFRGRPEIQAERRLCLFTRMIHKTLGDERLKVSFSTGTHGPHQKLTAQATRDGTVVSYIKIGESKPVSAILRVEAETLTWLHDRKFSAAYLPRVLAFDQHDEHTLLFLTPPTKPGIQRPLQADDKDTHFLSALASLHPNIVSVAQSFEHAGLGTYLERLQTIRPDAAELLRRAIEAIGSVLGKDGLRVTPCHGDYAPWNTLELEDGSLYVFDWEYGKQLAPALNDLFHRVLMPARLVLGQKPGALMHRLLELPNDPVLSPVISQSAVSKEELPAYVLMYLLGRLAIRGGNTLDEFLTESIRHTLMLTGHITQRRKVLVSAYACEPGRGSEPGVGWHMCQAISREHEAWVITRKNNMQQIESALVQQPNPHLHFCYADLPGWMRFWKKGQRGIRLYYYLWQFAALREAIRLMHTVTFNVAHHVTFVNDFMFTFLALLPIPFAWGPVGSVSKRPASLTDGKLSLLRERAIYYSKVALRSVDPLFWLSASRAKLILGTNIEIGRRFPFSLLAQNKYIRHIAIGVEQHLACDHISKIQSPDDGLRVLSMGRLIPLKAFHLSIQAFAILSRKEPSAKFTIVGDGPLRPSLEKLAVELNIREKVNFVQWLPRSEALGLMREADVFLFPSFEAAGMVVLEAMAHGLPVVCLENSGPAEMVTQECGFTVEVGPMIDTLEKLANALETLARDRALRIRMGTEARRVVQDKYLWEDRYKMIRQWYRAAGIDKDVLAGARKSSEGRSA